MWAFASYRRLVWETPADRNLARMAPSAVGAKVSQSRAVYTAVPQPCGVGCEVTWPGAIATKALQLGTSGREVQWSCVVGAKEVLLSRAFGAKIPRHDTIGRVVLQPGTVSAEAL